MERVERSRVEQCPGCVERDERHALDVQVFEEQIAGLKILLAGKEQMIARLTSEAAIAKERRFDAERSLGRRAENLEPPKKGLGGQYTPHGENCTCLACGTGDPAAVAEAPCPYPCMKRHVHNRRAMEPA